MCVGSDLKPGLCRGVPIGNDFAICFGNISIMGFLFFPLENHSSLTFKDLR